MLAYNDMVTALERSLSDTEETVLSYCSGYFFKKLMGYHNKNCQQCSSHGEKFTADSIVQQQSDIFMFFKRYSTPTATLYKCSDHFKDFVRTIIKVTNYCADYFIAPEVPIVNMVLMSVKAHLIQSSLPKLCNEAKLERFTKLVARTMLAYRIKWLNGKLKVKKKFTKGSAKGIRKRSKSTMSKSQKKLEKLIHA